jgi:hypothetical protein
MEKLMKRPTLLVIGIIIAVSIVLSSKRVGADPIEKTPPWNAKMQELYKALSELLTDVTSNGRFNDPGNRARIQAEAEKLASLVHDLNKKGMVRADVDPTVQMVAAMLGRETKYAAEELKRGNREYARTILRSVPTYCIACHTRNTSGVQFSELPLEPSSGSLSSVERGEFFAASRQFDRAQDQFKNVIRDPKTAQTNIFDWEQAVHQSLAIAVRVKNDPAEAREIVKAILKTPNAPTFMKEDAKAWLTSINEWQQEPPHHAMTEERLYAEAVRLMGKARETQKYPMDRTADIYYLRASAATHDLLQVAPMGEHSGEAMLLAGLSYEVLSPVNLEDLHEAFYGACIRKSPHTPTAEICYRRLEADVTADFTGSAGTDIPEDVRLNLKDLQQVSQPTLINVRQ